MKTIIGIKQEWKILIIILAVLMISICSISTTSGQSDPYGSEDEENTLPDWAAGTLFFFFCCGLPILFLGLAIWVYKDAEARGKEGAVWLIVVLLTYGFGLIIWLIVRPPHKIGEGPIMRSDQAATCPQCGGPVKFRRDKNKWGCPRCKRFVTPIMQRSRPPPPPRPRSDWCPQCGAAGEYSQEYNDYFCWGCEEYIGDM